MPRWLTIAVEIDKIRRKVFIGEIVLAWYPYVYHLLTNHFQCYDQIPETFSETNPAYFLLATTERLASGSIRTSSYFYGRYSYKTTERV